MGTGYLLMNVYADNIGQPVEGAMIEVTTEEGKVKLSTNAQGQTDVIDISCPDKIYSLNPQKEVRPYSKCTIKVIKEGLQSYIVEGVQILDGCTAIQDIYMNSQPEKDAPPTYTMIDEHILWDDYPPKMVVDPETMLPIEPSGDILLEPLIPEYIIVKDGLPTNNSAAIYYVPFVDYIKNVASSEIYSTWEKESLKANIYAILSFTGSRVYSEWYLARGYLFTITSSTQFDQKYIHNRNIFKEISDVVDEIFDTFIRRGNNIHPFFAQYNDGKRVNNPGWLSQWGSQDLALKGYSALQIIRHYYGNDMSLVKAKVIEGVPQSFPGFNLELGLCSKAIQEMQIRLSYIRGSYPGIPAIYSTDGRYDQTTVEAVKVFQRVFSLPVTGIVNFATWYKISYVFIGVSKMLQGRYQ